ncbi:hypothetical protein L209DRAFT_751352, partial [Thermothelomyces heterothallicus CBS 203.75]
MRPRKFFKKKKGKKRMTIPPPFYLPRLVFDAGRAGNRTQDFSHARVFEIFFPSRTEDAKRTLYQLSHTPLCEEVEMLPLRGGDPCRCDGIVEDGLSSPCQCRIGRVVGRFGKRTYSFLPATGSF